MQSDEQTGDVSRLCKTRRRSKRARDRTAGRDIFTASYLLAALQRDLSVAPRNLTEEARELRRYLVGQCRKALENGDVPPDAEPSLAENSMWKASYWSACDWSDEHLALLRDLHAAANEAQQ